MDVYGRLTLAAAEFGKAEKYILDLFGLGDLIAADFWAQIMAQRSDKRKERIQEIIASWTTFARIMPKLIDLLVSDKHLFEDVLHNPTQETTHLSFVFEATPDHKIDADNIETLFRAIRSLHAFVTEFYEIKDAKITLAYCDTGSITEFVFASSSKCIYYMRVIIFSTWERLFFPGDKKAEMRIDRAKKRVQVVAEAVPVLTEINARRRELGAKNAKNLEHAVLEALQSLVDSGAGPRGVETIDSQTLLPGPTDPPPRLLTFKNSGADDATS